MKKYILFFLFLFACITASAQPNDLKAVMTQDELSWSEDTRDAAYLAPNTKFVGKKWFYRKSGHFIFNQNGTYKQVERYESDEYGDNVVLWTESTPGTWKRQKSFLTINCNTKQKVYNLNTSSIKSYSLRKQDLIKTNLARMQSSDRQKNPWSEQFELYRLDDDILILYSNGSPLYLFSEKKIMELVKRVKNKAN